MKIAAIETIRTLWADRLFVSVIAAMIAVCVGLTLYVALSIQPSELQVNTHYTSFGQENFYRSEWIELLSFVVFGIFIAIIHTAIAAKLYLAKSREFAIIFAAGTILLVVVSAVLIGNVLGIAAL